MLIKNIFGLFLSFLMLGCGGIEFNSANAQNNGNKTAVKTGNNQSKSMIKIQQGTVGKVGKFSVGVSNIGNSSARLAIWNNELPQDERNDYLITTAVQTGETIPVGDGLYRVGKIAENASVRPAGTVEIENEQVKAEGVSLNPNSLYLPIEGTLELHAMSIELVSIKTEGEKTVAEIEIYSNDYPKESLVKENKIKKLQVSSGDEIEIGNKKHKVTTIYPAKDSIRGMVGISINPS